MTTMKLVWCPDMASKAYIDTVRAIANANTDSIDGSSPELVAAMAGGWNAQLIIDAPNNDTSPSSSSSSTAIHRRPPATSLVLTAVARSKKGRYARLHITDDVNDAAAAHPEQTIINSGSGSSTSAAEAAIERLEGMGILFLDARRHDAVAVLRAAWPGPRGMVVVRHGDITSGGGGVRRRAAAPLLWGMAAGTRVMRAAYLPIGASGVEVLQVGVGKGPSLLPHQHSSRRSGFSERGRWIRHVNHRTGEEHVFRR